MCGKCGLVLEDQRFESTLVFQTPPRKSISPRKSKWLVNSRSSKMAELKEVLDPLLKEEGLSATQVQEDIVELYILMRNRSMTHGYSTSIIAKALLYSAFRMHRVPMNLSELVKNSAKDRREILRCYRQICRKLELYIPRLEDRDYLAFFAAKTGFGKEVEDHARVILAKAREKRLLNGTNPVGFTAAAFYVASNAMGKGLTQRKMARMAGISEVTIRADLKILQSAKA